MTPWRTWFGVLLACSLVSGAEPSGSAADRIQPTREQAEAIRQLVERVAVMPVPEALERRTIRVGDREREYFLHGPPQVAGRPTRGCR